MYTLWTFEGLVKARNVFRADGADAAAAQSGKTVRAIYKAAARGWKPGKRTKDVPTLTTIALTLAEEGGVTARDLEFNSLSDVRTCREILRRLAHMGVLRRSSNYQPPVYTIAGT